MDRLGRFTVGMDDCHVIRGETLEELADAIDSRLVSVAEKTDGVRLAAESRATLRATWPG